MILNSSLARSKRGRHVIVLVPSAFIGSSYGDARIHTCHLGAVDHGSGIHIHNVHSEATRSLE